MSRLFRVIRSAGYLLVCGLVLLEMILGAAVAWASHTDHELVVITGGSMEPTFAVGSAILVERLDDHEVRPGVVVTFRSADDVLTTHRVIARRAIDGVDFLQTQGDANPDPDPNFTPVGSVVGTPRAEIPNGGYAASFLLSPLGRWLVFGPPLLLVLLAELRVLRHRLRDTADPQGPVVPAPVVPVPLAAPAAVVSPPAVFVRRPQLVTAGSAVTCVAVLLASVAVGTMVARSGAVFAATASVGDITTSTATLQPPTGVTATAVARSAHVTWSASASPFATGYEIFRAVTASGPWTLVGTVQGRATTTYADGGADGTVRYRVRAMASQWRSADSAVVVTTVSRPAVTTGYLNCTSQSADTGGDGNGFEYSPANACGSADDVFAGDLDSGYGSVNQCVTPGNDRHRFGTWNTGIPAHAIVTGLEVRHVGGRTESGSGASTCVQLSGDGGATWTAAKGLSYGQSVLESTLTFGGPADLWGATWTPDMLANGRFMVRVTNVSTTTTRDFGLDSLQIRVSFR